MQNNRSLLGEVITLRCSGARVLRCSGAPALGCSGAPVLRCSGAPVLGCSGAPVLRRSGAPALRRSCAPALLCSGAPAHRCSGARAHRCTGAPVLGVLVMGMKSLCQVFGTIQICYIHFLSVGRTAQPKWGFNFNRKDRMLTVNTKSKSNGANSQAQCNVNRATRT